MRTHGKSRTFFAIACLCVLGLVAFIGSSAPSVGAAETFPGQGFLPDGRAWEMVSPPDKNDGNVAPDTDRTRAAADGNALAFVSQIAFKDALGTGFTVEYLAKRDAAPETNGWSTHAISPRQRTSNVVVGPYPLPNSRYHGQFSADLSQGLFASWRPLSDEAPNVAPVPNLYLREDLTTPGPGSYRLLTDSVNPIPPVPPPFSEVPGLFAAYLNTTTPIPADASADFEHVVFESTLGLTHDVPMPSDSELLFGGASVKLYENVGGEVRYVGYVPASGSFCDETAAFPCEAAPSSGVGARNQSYTEDTISRDGSRIFFGSHSNVYLREDGTRTFQMNASEKEAPGEPQEARLWDASADGSRAFFSTNEQLLEEDEDGEFDLYMYEVEKPEGERLTLVSVSGTGESGNLEAVIGASADGSYVYFAFCCGQLVPGEPPGLMGIYLWHEGQLSYIGRFRAAGEAEYNSPRTAGWSVIESKLRSRISPDGRHLLFMTHEDDGVEGRGGFAGYEHNGHEEVYLYDADSGQLRCVSCNPAGTPASAHAYIDSKHSDVAGLATSVRNPSQALSDDGRYVFFSTQESLVPEDTNGVFDAYVYDAESEETNLLSSGEDDKGSWFVGASPDGRDAFIGTAERLSRWDVDGAYDIYDARVDGGLPEPKLVPPSCQGDACQPAPVQLNDPTPASSSFRGQGDPNMKARCPKGKRRVKARGGKSRCVARKKNRRIAKSNRRAGR